MTYNDKQKEVFHKHIEDLLKKMEQRDELEAKLYDWYLYFVEGDGAGSPENTLKFRQAKLEKLVRMRKRIDKQIADLRPEVETLTRIVKNRAEKAGNARDYANGTDPKDVPNI
jgi:hypothetical protein